MHRGAIPILAALIGCSPRSATPSAPPATSSTAANPLPGPAPTPEPIAETRPPRTRAGECDLDKAIADLLKDQEVARCGDLDRRAATDVEDRARACVLGAQAARKAFTVSWGGPSIDSIIREAIVGRSVDGRYEVLWFHYDSCPSGCGVDDPGWTSSRCDKIEDLRKVCPSIAKAKGKIDDELRWLCDEDDGPRRRRPLEVWCAHRESAGHCPDGAH